MHIKFLLENLKGRPLGRHKHSWEDNIRMELREAGYESLKWMHLAQDRNQ
jgi:hypothetical protein